MCVVTCSYSRSDPELTSNPTTPSSLYTDEEVEESLLSALEEGDFDTALPLLPLHSSKEGGGATRVGPDQLTPLHYACQHGRLDVVEYLIRDHCYDLSALCSLQPTPLQIAAASGSTSVVDYILKSIAATSLAFKPGDVNPLHLAADNGYLEVAQLLLTFDRSLLATPDQDGNGPLHHACAYGHLSLARYLCSISSSSSGTKHPSLVLARNKQGETALHLASRYGHLEIVHFLVEDKHCDPALRDSGVGCTPLHLAAKGGHLDVVQYLGGEKGCGFDVKTSSRPRKGRGGRGVVSGRTPLHYASYGGQCVVVRFLVEDQLCSPCCSDDQGFTPLHLACQEGHSEVVRYLLGLKETELHQMVNHDGLTPVHAASLSGNLEIMKLLIEQNDGNPSAIDSEGRTALHYSSCRGHTDVARYLVQDGGVAPSCRDESNITPLHLAAQYGCLDTVKFLLCETLASAGATEENGYTPLHLAANKGRLAVVEFLVSGSGSVIGEFKHSTTSCMVRDKAGRTPLHHACQSGHLEVVRYLTALPECDSACTEKNLKASPLHLAASFGHLEVVRFLVEEKGCSPTCTDKFNSTPLHRAAGAGHCHVMTYLVKGRQCSPTLKNKFGNTPLHLACQSSQVKMVELLLSFSKENMSARNQVGRMPLDLTDSTEILSMFLRNGADPSRGSITTKFPYLKCWDTLSMTVKIFLLGDLDSGKSTLAKALQGGGFFQEWVAGRFQRVTPPDAETSGIIPITFASKHFGRALLYDFAGHPSYHASHSVIMDIASRGSSPIFLVAVDLRKSPELVERSVAYWWMLVQLISSKEATQGGEEDEVGEEGEQEREEFKPHLILVGTHEDELSKESTRHVPAMLERIALSGSGNDNGNGGSKHKFSGWISVDCRKPNSASIQKLRQLIAQRCDTLGGSPSSSSSSSSSHLDHRSCLLRSFMLHKFQGSSVVEFQELLEYLTHTKIPDLKTKGDIRQACRALHSYGYVLFLESQDSLESSWVIHNQEAILSMVHGFHKLVEIPNPLGLVSLTQLQTGLGSTGFNITLATRYLLRMEFCIKLADRRVLHAVSGFDPPHPLEDHLFFPHLVRSSAPPDVWEGGGANADAWDRHFGWYMSCVEEGQMLGPRFAQLLMLRLASRFCFNTDPNSPFSTRRASCVIWRRGLSWCDSRGIEGAVEVRGRSREVLFLCRRRKKTEETLSSSLDFFHFRSSVMVVVRQVKSETCARVRVTESVIHPESLAQAPPCIDTDTDLVYPMVKLADIFGSVMEGLAESSPGTVSWEQTLLDSERVELTTTSCIGVQDLLEFEPFLGLPREVLTLLFSKQGRRSPITDEHLQDISQALPQGVWQPRHLLIVLGLPYSTGRAANHVTVPAPASHFRTVLDRWMARTNGKRTFGDLFNLFCQYSVFDDDNVVEN